MTLYQMMTLMRPIEELGSGTFAVDAGRVEQVEQNLQANRRLRGEGL